MISSLRAIYARPNYDEAISARVWRESSMIRLVTLLLCVAVDTLFIVAAPGTSFLDAGHIHLVYGATVFVLSIDILVTWGMFCGRWRDTRLLACFVVIEMVGTVLIIQATGTMQSPIMLVGLGSMVFYRVFFGWRMAVHAVGVLAIGHGGAIALEVSGFIAPMPAFLAPAPFAYDLPLMRLWNTALLCIIYLFTFFGANAIINLIRRKDRALAEARARAERLAKDVAQGRLTGALIKERYSVGELLGRGGMGEVYLAHDVDQDRDVAIKVLHHAFGGDMEMLGRFRREAELAAILPGHCTATIFDVGIDYDADAHFIVMQHLRGEDLGAVLRRRGRLTCPEALAVGRELARVLDVAHACGVVHRDLKPQNTYLVATDSSRLDVRLLDFGIAKLAEPRGGPTLTRGPSVLGSPGYMSPEQAAGNTATAGPAADRFALAAIMFRAITGSPPFGNRTALEYLQELATATPRCASELVPGLPTAVDAVFERALSREPSARHETAGALLSALSEALTPWRTHGGSPVAMAPLAKSA